MKRALLLLLAFSAFALAAEATPAPHWYERVSLSESHTSQQMLLLDIDGARLTVNGNEFLVDLVDRSPDSVALKITHDGEVLCSGLEPNCILKAGQENDALLAMTGVRISWTPSQYSDDMSNGALILFELPGPACVQIYGSAAVETGLNLAFVSDGFEKGEEAEFKAAAVNAVRDLISVAPYSRHAAAVNAYYVPASFGKSYEFTDQGMPEGISNAVRECRQAVTVLLSKEFWKGETALASRGFARLPAPLYLKSRSDALTGRLVVAHEFAHAIAELDDETFNESRFASGEGATLVYAPNTDMLGCGKWCSGANGGGKQCNTLWAAFSNCQGKGAECVAGVSAAYGADALAALLACNFGSDCVSGTGCYAGVGYVFITAFKPVKSDCIMGDLYSARFCPVCERALEEKLKEFG
ncbi:hypothetical protein COX86_02255 [Candidatus Micrarchaeota archaeon CG_4_10_14_0_2_um_filter_60_11]|nr:MAG: hypothetical protein AUJ16_02805 [Candidatus Micrarchaeota archaeon CG1_02_60_51]PIN96323.1 MAG: hypothetical protein COU39_01960 [Candidatus Micrarchaeota archaeon CG10_big_fil_rev_8_21_14_0_10_60_32]PIO01942.1 MAG: hypothetical protein COT58_02325 [Candidatus Micrarchaeota archaeon CG09_land_8_20_14_0_10_60_16]PIY91182.1 MAG: hypothetical protein COY71_04535 [Candidatus Micrarchaeota archaeon CG_4_10_14_0_8_um_filter_60_7]PIZ90942.1 MAG: hypothetical protein COX86_02255 [Candidatus Mi